jgi:serine/threonine-protein kinase
MEMLGAEATPSSSRATLAPGTLVGDFRVERLLGEGGSATVYAATHQHIGKKAAIKVLKQDLNRHPIAVERMVAEARAVNRIAHPNVVDIFAWGQLPDGRTYLVMEWLQGDSLESALVERELAPQEIVEILTALCDALEAVHEAGVIHRDLKPANVFLQTVKGRSPQVKLLDFGIAKLEEDAGRTKTRTGWLLGTPEYLAPEQARGQSVEPRTDIYALGVTAYEMFVGQRPFSAECPIDLINQHLCAPPPSPRSIRPDLPLAVENLLLWMLTKEIDHRPTLAQVRERLGTLRDLVAGDHVEKRAQIEPARIELHVGSQRWILPWALTMALTAGALVAWRSWAGSRVQTARVAVRQPPPPRRARTPDEAAPAKPKPAQVSRQKDYLVDPFAGSQE